MLLSTILLRQGKLEQAHTTVRDGLALANQLSDPWSIGYGLRTLGEIYLKQNEYVKARENFEKSLEASRVVGDKVIIGGVLINLAVLTNVQGQYEESDRYAEEALGIFQLIGDETHQPFPMRIMGYAAIHTGNLVRAGVLMRESLSGNYVLHEAAGQLACLVGIAYCELTGKNVEKAILLLGLAEKNIKERNIRLLEPDELAVQSIISLGKKKLGEAGFEEIFRQGQSLDLDDTIKQLMA